MYYLLILIPIFITIIFYIFRKSEIKWWEFFIPVGAGLILLLIAKLIVNYTTVTFDEYWGSNVVAVYEEEPYNYWHHQTCYRTVTTGKTTITIPYDCSHQVDVGPCWTAKTDLGEEIRLTEDEYEEIKTRFKTSRAIIDSHTNYDYNDRCANSNGTKFERKQVGRVSYTYQVKWDDSDATRKPYFSSHSYKNKIKSSDITIFNLSKVSDKLADTLNLFKYPENIDGFDCPTILGNNISKEIQEDFKKLNGKFGVSNQMRLWVLVFEDKPLKIAYQQESYWVRGNMNELVICIGKNKNNKIDWCHTFSWSLSTELTADISGKVMNLYQYKDTTYQNEFKIPVYGRGSKKHKIVKYNTIYQDSTAKVKQFESSILTDKTWGDLYQYLNNNLQRYERRSFKEFDYLTVKPSNTSLIVISIVLIIISLGLNIWIVNNEFSDDDEYTNYYSYDNTVNENKPNKLKQIGIKIIIKIKNLSNKWK